MPETYYKNLNVAGTREEMLLYLHDLIRTKDMVKALEVSTDFLALENIITLDNDVKLVTLNPKHTPMQQLNTLVRHANTWVDKETAYPEAVELVRSLLLTHNQLLQFAETSIRKPRYIKLVAAHHNWDSRWMNTVLNTNAARLLDWDRATTVYRHQTWVQTILNHTSNMALILDVYKNNHDNPHFSISMENTSHLDEKTLLVLLRDYSQLTLLSDPRVTKEIFTEVWETHFQPPSLNPTEYSYQHKIKGAVKAAAHNPNAPGWLLAESARILQPWLLKETLQHPNLQANTIVDLAEKYTSHKEVRILLAQHPNTPTSVLRKLAKSNSTTLAAIAQGQLDNRETTIRKRR